MSTTFMTITNEDLLKACPFGTTQLPTNWGDLMDLQDKVARGEFPNSEFLESLSSEPEEIEPKIQKPEIRKTTKKRSKKDNWEQVKSEPKKRNKVITPVHQPARLEKPRFNQSHRHETNTDRTIVLKNLPRWDTYIIDMLVHFEKFGEIEFVNVLRNEDRSCKGIAFLRFKNPESTIKAIDDGNYWQDDRMIKVESVK